MGKQRKVAEPRTELIGIRYTLEERQQLEAQADPIPLSTYIRNLSLHRSRPKSVPAINLEAYQELQKMSLTLARINHALSSAKEQGEFASEQLQEWFTSLQDFKLEIKQMGLNMIGANLEDIDTEESKPGEFTL